VILIELRAGVGVWSLSFQQYGIPLVAFLEHEALLSAFLSHSDLYSAAQAAGLFEDRMWEHWILPSDAVVIVADGSSCSSLSAPAKRQACQGPSSRHLADALELATFFRADFIILEEVPDLIRNDESHGLFSALRTQAESLLFCLADPLFLHDSELGGFTQRERVFLLFESVRASLLLPCWLPVGRPPDPALASCLKDILLDASELPSDLILPGDYFDRDFDADSLPSDDSPFRALRVGSLRWRASAPCVGSLVELKQQHRGSGWNRWRVIELAPPLAMLTRTQNSSPDSRWVELDFIRSVCDQHIPVYSAARPGAALCQYGEPPLDTGFAVLRPFSGVVTTLAPLEVWRAHGLTDDLAVVFTQVGGSLRDLAAAASNCTARCCADRVTEIVSARAMLLQQRLLLPLPQSAWRSPAEAVPDGHMRVVLIPFRLGSPPTFFMAPRGSFVLTELLEVDDRAHQAAHSVANRMAESMFTQSPLSFLAARLEDERTLVFALPISNDDFPTSLWTADSMLPNGLRQWCSLVADAVLTLLPPPPLSALASVDPAYRARGVEADHWQRAQLTAITQVGTTGRSAVVRSAAMTLQPCGESEAWLLGQRHQIELDNVDLKADLLALAETSSVSVAASLKGWADAVKPVPWSEIPSGLHSELDGCTNPMFATLLFPEPCPPHATEWLPRASQPSTVQGFNPRCLEDLLTAESIQLIEDWMLTQLAFLEEIKVMGSKAQRRSNTPLALGQDCFVAEARGIVWDLRRLSEGIIVPVDFAAPILSHLNKDLLSQLLSSHPDQELRSFLLEGVRYKDDLDLQIVLLPHLISLRDGYDSLLAEVHKYKQKGWYGLFEHPPFLPFRLVPKGSVPRKLEPDRPRPTTEATAPRKPLWDTGGIPVISSNHASSGRPPEQLAGIAGSVPLASVTKWPPENKPAIADALITLVVLSHIGRLLGLPLFLAADDFKNFFNQLKTAPEQWWKCCMVVSELSKPFFASEYMMTFGVSPASNIAQRFADSILWIFRRRMVVADAPFLEQEAREYPQLRAWLEDRLLLLGCDPALQCQLYAALIYTDDPLFMVLGAARMARALAVWTQLCEDVGLLMAIADKRQCGSHVYWLGAGLLGGLALAWASPHKLISALEKLGRVIAKPSTLTVGEYHSLLGLLEHLLFLNAMRRNIMYGMWHPFQQSFSPDPSALLKATPLMLQQAHRWRAVLRSSAGVSGIRLVSKGIAPGASASLSCFTTFSDAALSEDFAGMGGWFHGYYWHFALPRKLRRRLFKLGLCPAVFEFIGSIVSSCTFLSLLPAPKAGTVDHHVMVRSDASSTVLVQAADSAKSQLMQELHLEALNDSTYHAWLPALMFAHLYGIGNELADAASRGDFERLLRLARQLQVSPVRLEPHPVMLLLLATVERVLTPVERALGMAAANTPTSASFVKLTASDAALRSFGLLGEKNRIQRLISAKAGRGRRERKQPVIALVDSVLPFVLPAARRPALSSRTELRLSKGLKKAPVFFPPIRCFSSVPSVKRLHLEYSPRNSICSGELDELDRLADEGANIGTTGIDRGHWKYWLSFCAERGIHPLRDDIDANSGRDSAGYKEECEILALFLVFVTQHMNAKGHREEPLPASSANVVRGVRRVHSKQRPPIAMVPFATVRATLKGLNKRYIAKYSYKMLLPRRREPWRTSWLKVMFSLRVKQGAVIAHFSAADSILWASYFALHETLAQTGFRRSEVACKHRARFNPAIHISRASLMWKINGVIYSSPTPAQLRALTSADHAILLPPPSKADEFGVIWGDKPIYLPVRRNAWCSAAVRLAELELLAPLSGKERGLHPLFMMDWGVPFSYHYLDVMLTDHKAQCLPDSVDHSLFSYHSHRIRLASALGSVDPKVLEVTDEHILAMCRWQSAASLKVYKRMQPETYTALLDAAMDATITSYGASSLIIDSADLAAQAINAAV
jgi:hypothetical protein